MERLKKTDRYLDLSEYDIREKFYVYELGKYDFSENLKFNDTIGVYMFTNFSGDTYIPSNDNRNFFYHTPIYCGKTSDTDTRFYKHHKGKESINIGANAFAFHPCNKDEEAVALENKLLSCIDFPENKTNNSDATHHDVKIKSVKF